MSAIASIQDIENILVKLSPEDYESLMNDVVSRRRKNKVKPGEPTWAELTLQLRDHSEALSHLQGRLERTSDLKERARLEAEIEAMHNTVDELRERVNYLSRPA